MRDVLIWSVRLLVVFIVLMGASFVVLTLLAPSPEVLDEMVAKVETRSQADTSRATIRRVVAVDSFQTIIDSLGSELFFMHLLADSLELQLEEKQDELVSYVSQLELLNKQVQEASVQQATIKDLAKTYETMKINDIKPILDKVDDATVIALYNNMGSRTKKNLMQALSSVRAAQITKKIAGMKP